MKISVLPAFASIVALTAGDKVTYDTVYDSSTTSLNNVACSNGPNGLITRYGWQTLGQIPTFPRLGGAAAVSGWNSKQYGTCWSLEYKGKSIKVLAVDTAGQGFNIGKKAMNELTGGQAEKLGTVQADAKQVDVKQCGLKKTDMSEM